MCIGWLPLINVIGCSKPISKRNPPVSLVYLQQFTNTVLYSLKGVSTLDSAVVKLCCSRSQSWHPANILLINLMVMAKGDYIYIYSI